jgi:hypothetical protein
VFYLSPELLFGKKETLEEYESSDGSLSYSPKGSENFMTYKFAGGYFVPNFAWLEAGAAGGSTEGFSDAYLRLGNRSLTGRIQDKLNLGGDWGMEWGAKGFYNKHGSSKSAFKVDFGGGYQGDKSVLSSDEESSFDRLLKEKTGIDFGGLGNISLQSGSFSNYGAELSMGVRSPVLLNCLGVAVDFASRYGTQEKWNHQTMLLISPLPGNYLLPFGKSANSGGVKYPYAQGNVMFDGSFSKVTQWGISPILSIDLPGSKASINLKYDYVKNLANAASRLGISESHFGTMQLDIPSEYITRPATDVWNFVSGK